MSAKKAKAPATVVAILIILGLAVAYWAGYNTSETLQRYEGVAGFRLPPGDTENGMAAFARLGCVACHSVSGSEAYPTPEEPVAHHVVLGGRVHVVKTYGELVTAIIHPSESIRPDVRTTLVDEQGRSIMPDLTGRMTTRQLIDLVTWLEDQYEVTIPEYPRNYYPYDIDLAP